MTTTQDPVQAGLAAWDAATSSDPVQAGLAAWDAASKPSGESASRARFANRIKASERAQGTIYASDQGVPYGQMPGDFNRLPPGTDVLKSAAEMGVSALNAVPETAQGLVDTAGVAIPGLRDVQVPRIPDIPGEAGGIAQGIGSSVGHLGILAGTGAVGGTASAASLAALEGFGAHYHTLKAEGASETGALLGALGQSGVDAAAIAVPLGRLAKAEGGLGSAITNGYVFGGAAGAQQVVTDAITAAATPKDMGSWLDWADRVGEAAVKGGLAGLFVGAVHSAFKAMTPKEQAKVLKLREEGTPAPGTEPTPGVAEQPATIAPQSQDIAPAEPFGASEQLPAEPAPVAEPAKRPVIQNEKGEPQVFYHGTSSPTDTFSRGQLDELSMGFWFTKSKAEAERYAGTAEGESRGGGTPRVVEAHLSVSNPADFATWQKALKEAGGSFAKSVEILRAQGYDGMSRGKGNVVVAFDPEQIRPLAPPPAEAQPQKAEPVLGGTTGSDVSPRPGAAPSDAEGAAPIRPPEAASERSALPQARQREPAASGESASESNAPEGVSIKNAKMAEDLRALDLEPPEKRRTVSIPETLAEAQRVLEQDPGAATSLIADLERKPRPLSNVEGALLLHERNRIEGELASARKARDNGTPSDDRIEAAKNDLARLAEVARAAGEEGGRGHQFRQAFVAQDFTFTGIERRLSDAKGGEPLTETEAQRAKDLANEYALAEEKAKTAERERRISELERKVAEMERDVGRTARRASPRARIHREASAEARANIDKLFHELATTAHTVGPHMVEILRKLAVEHIKLGYHSFAEWAAIVREKVGDKADAHLEAAWHAARIEHVTERMKARLSEGSKLSDMGRYVDQIMRRVIESGVKGRENVVAAVHDALKAIDPKITLAEAEDAISGYGKFKPLSKDPIAVEMRDIKGQLQQIGKLRDLEARQPPKKTGPERREPTPAERRLQKRVKEMTKELGIKVTDPATQIKSTLASLETRLRNRIQDLRHEIDMRELSPESDKPSPTSPTVEALRKELKATLAEHEAMFGKKTATDEEKAAAALKATQESLAEYERRVREHDLSNPPEKQGPPTAETDRLRRERDRIAAKRDLLRKQLDELKAAAEPPKRDPAEVALEKQIAALSDRIEKGQIAPRGEKQGPDTEAVTRLKAQRDELTAKLEAMRKAANPPKSPEERAREAYLRRKESELAHLHERLLYEDFAPREKKAPRALSAAEQLAKAETGRVATKVRREEMRYERARMSAGMKARDWFLRASRAAVLSGVDIVGKLSAAAGARMVTTPMEEVVGTVLKRLPYVKGIAERAPRHGSGFNPRIEAKAFASFWTEGMKAAYDRIAKGEDKIAAQFGDKKQLYERSWLEMIGSLHSALKAPAAISEYRRSFEKFAEEEIRLGNDPGDPIVAQRIGLKAFVQSKRAEFGQDNRLANGMNGLIRALEVPDKETGKTPLLSLTGATGLRFAQPVLKVPSNVVTEVIETSFGSMVGAAKVARIYTRGIESLSPHEADIVMRTLKKGSIGAAGILIGYFGASSIGGYYRPNKKKNEIPPGDLEVFGERLSHTFLHSPALDTLQFGATVRQVQETSGSFGAGTYAAMIGMLDQVPTIGLAQDIGAATDPRTGQVSAGRILGGRVVPSGLRWLARVIDREEKRRARGFWENVQSGIPFWRESLPVKR